METNDASTDERAPGGRPLSRAAKAARARALAIGPLDWLRTLEILTRPPGGRREHRDDQTKGRR
jgi:hypothetical protein